MRRAALLLLVAVLGFFAARIVEIQRGRPLSLWHEHVPEELHADALDRADWSAYLAAEDAVFAEVRHEVTERLEPEDRVAINRYYEGSPMYPGRFATDWNRSFVLEPDTEPVARLDAGPAMSVTPTAPPPSCGSLLATLSTSRDPVTTSSLPSFTMMPPPSVPATFPATVVSSTWAAAPPTSVMPPPQLPVAWFSRRWLRTILAAVRSRSMPPP